MNLMDRFEETELQAYVDGRLSPDRALAVAAYLDQYPDDANRIAQYVSHWNELRARLQPKFDEPVPPRLRVGHIRAEQKRMRTRRMTRLAAMIAIGVFGAMAGWVASPYLHGAKLDPLVAEAIAVRGGDVRPEQQFYPGAVATPSVGDRLVKSTLDVPAKIPDLAKAGYVLTGVAIYPSRAGGHALQISYRDGGGRSFTLYMHRSMGADRFDLQQRGATQICIWQNEDLSVVMLGEMPSKEMLKVATLTYGDLNF